MNKKVAMKRTNGKYTDKMLIEFVKNRFNIVNRIQGLINVNIHLYRKEKPFPEYIYEDAIYLKFDPKTGMVTDYSGSSNSKKVKKYYKLIKKEWLALIGKDWSRGLI